MCSLESNGLLVNRRNNIAHGGRVQSFKAVDYHQYKDLVLSLISALESAVLNTIRSSHFLSESRNNE